MSERKPKIKPCKKCGSSKIELWHCGYSSFNPGGGKCECGHEVKGEAGCLPTQEDLARIWNAGQAETAEEKNATLATENARLRELLEQCVSVFTDRGEERHPDEETVLDAARSALAGQPVAPAPRVTLESEVDRRVKSIMANREKYVEAWIAETGMKPSECQLIEQITSDMATRIVRADPAPQADAVKVLREALTEIASLNGNLPLNQLNEKCGPNDGASRGIRLRIAIEASQRALAATEGV